MHQMQPHPHCPTMAVDHGQHVFHHDGEFYSCQGTYPVTSGQQMVNGKLPALASEPPPPPTPPKRLPQHVNVATAAEFFGADGDRIPPDLVNTVRPLAVPGEWLAQADDPEALMTTAQQIRSEAIRAASGLYLAHADDVEEIPKIAEAVIMQARRIAAYIETGE